MKNSARGSTRLPAALTVPLAFVIGPQTAQAGSSCTKANQAVTDYAGKSFPYRYYCSTYVGSPVYANIAAGTKAALDDSGYMYQASSVWVVCQVKGAADPVIQGNTNTWWLYTQGDVARSNAYGYGRAWGFLPATAVSQGGQNQPVPGVATCASSTPTQTIGSAPGATETFGSAP